MRKLRMLGGAGGTRDGVPFAFGDELDYDDSKPEVRAEIARLIKLGLAEDVTPAPPPSAALAQTVVAASPPK